MQKLYVVISDSYDPYYNLALEELLLKQITQDSITLYLWQNDNTVVIGRNQNAWAECRTSVLTEEGGRLARRLSGGGAVYHDLGNLNFTFLCNENQYNLPKQLSVIQKAVGYAGIQAVFSGRNDLLADNCKFSGNAFYHSQGLCYHHGTLLIDSDLNKLQRYLSPPKAKLQSKGISSVRSRVTNLRRLAPELTCLQMKAYMLQAFESVYNNSAEHFPLTPTLLAQATVLQQKYASHEWLYGNTLPFSCRLEEHFPWGNLELQLNINAGIIKELLVYTDAMDAYFADQLCAALTDCPFQSEPMIQAVSGLAHEQDLISLFLQQVL